MNKVRVFNLQNRPNEKSPWRVKWTVDGKSKTRAFRTKAEADAFRSKIVAASSNQEKFDARTGEPVQWARTQTTFAQLATALVDRKAGQWEDRTLKSSVESLQEAVLALVHTRTRAMPERKVLVSAIRYHLLHPDRASKTPTPQEQDALRWIEISSLPLDALDEDTMELASD